METSPITEIVVASQYLARLNLGAKDVKAHRVPFQRCTLALTQLTQLIAAKKELSADLIILLTKSLCVLQQQINRHLDNELLNLTRIAELVFGCLSACLNLGRPVHLQHVGWNDPKFWNLVADVCITSIANTSTGNSFLSNLRLLYQGGKCHHWPQYTTNFSSDPAF